MSTNNFFNSDINSLYGLIQSSMIVYPKEVIIAHLRDYFSKDSLYSYRKDPWGFSKTVDNTDLPLDAGMFDNTSTRIHIGEQYRHLPIWYPSIIIKNAGAKYVPLSINRDSGTYETEDRVFDDGYGNRIIFKNPTRFVFNGVFEGSITINVSARSMRARDDLVELTAMFFTDVGFKDLEDIGLVIKPLSIGSPTETADRSDYVYSQPITLDYRMEWKRVIPVGNIIESILFTIEFQNLDNPESQPAPNLTINTEISLTDMMINL